MKKRIVVTNRSRFAGFVAVCLSMILAAVFISLPITQVRATDTDKGDSVLVYVRYGDTLWGIAKENNYNNKDIRNLVYEIMEYNNLESADIYQGQAIEIPV